MKTTIPLAPYPPTSIRLKIPSTQWQSLIDSWTFLTQSLLSANDDEFLLSIQDTRVVPFLISFLQHSPPEHLDVASAATSGNLNRQTLLLFYRLLSGLEAVPQELLAPSFFAQTIRFYGTSKSLKDLLEWSWIKHDLQAQKRYILFKADLIASLEASEPASGLHHVLVDSVCLAKAITSFSKFLLTGSDFIDALSSAYQRLNHSRESKRQVLVLTHICLSSLLISENSSSFLLDHLYNLQTTTLLQGLLQKTSYYVELERYVSHLTTNVERARALLNGLAPYRRKNEPPKGKRRADKGKGREVAGDDATTMVHAHQFSLVTQVQDLFPELGVGFVLKLLDAYDNDTEQTISHLLDDTLPVHLRNLDRTEQLESIPSLSKDTMIPTEDSQRRVRPSRTIVPQRKNVFDNDEFDRLEIDPSKLHKGRKNAGMTADELLSSQQPTNQKAAILSALAAFDSDDDERDDTYDTADVGGSIDNTIDESSAREKAEEILFPAFKRNLDMFSRNTETRRSKERAALRERTNMTDEAIEGWAIMLQRDPKRLRHLEGEYDVSAGLQQHSLASSAWRADSEAEDADGVMNQNAGRGRAPDRGGGSGRGRGHPSGPASDHSTQVARQRKDANKGSRANHNRRDQRARKVARAGGLVG